MGVNVHCLLDTGSQVTMLWESFVNTTYIQRRLEVSKSGLLQPLLKSPGPSWVWPDITAGSSKILQKLLYCVTAFKKLKQMLTCALILAFADFNQPFLLYTDASHQGLGAVRAQLQDGQECVVAYASRSLHPSETL